MNLEEHKLDGLVLAPFQVKEALRCVLHTILFSRSLGPTEPLEVQSELFDVTYMRNGTIETDKMVELAIERLASSLSIRIDGTSRRRVALSFYEKVETTSFFGGKKEGKRCWERWIVPIIVQTSSSSSSSSSRGRRRKRIEEKLRDCMMDIVKRVNEKMDHIPPANLNKSSSMIFLFDIQSGSSSSDSSTSWLSRLITG
jgi:autophagy-related protein 101